MVLATTLCSTAVSGRRGARSACMVSHSRAARPASGTGAGAEACVGLITLLCMLGQRPRSAASARVAVCRDSKSSRKGLRP
eukprot:15432389-Alexandrium_andersonii.AAC.1